METKENAFVLKFTSYHAKIILVAVKAALLCFAIAMTILISVIMHHPVLIEITMLIALRTSCIWQIGVMCLGLIGTWFDNQRVLYIYILALFPLFMVQATLSSCYLELTPEQQETILEAAWSRASPASRSDVQTRLGCCGFRDSALSPADPLGHPDCARLPCCSGASEYCCTGQVAGRNRSGTCPCTLTCLAGSRARFNLAVKLCGGISFPLAIACLFLLILTIKYHEMLSSRAVLTKYI